MIIYEIIRLNMLQICHYQIKKMCNHPITVILNGRNSNDKFAVVFYVVSSKIAFFGDYIAFRL
jgi:hypothetical protein